jgi:hypothetical protein
MRPWHRVHSIHATLKIAIKNNNKTKTNTIPVTVRAYNVHTIFFLNGDSYGAQRAHLFFKTGILTGQGTIDSIEENPPTTPAVTGGFKSKRNTTTIFIVQHSNS